MPLSQWLLNIISLLWPPELDVPGVFPLWAAWILLLQQADFCGHPGHWGGPLSWLAVRPCLVQCCGCSVGWHRLPVWLVTMPGRVQLLWVHWWAGQAPGTNRLEARFQNDICQPQCQCGRTRSPKWLQPESPPAWGSQLPPASPRSASRSETDVTLIGTWTQPKPRLGLELTVL